MADIKIIEKNVYSLLIIDLNELRLNMESHKGPNWGPCLFNVLVLYWFRKSICEVSRMLEFIMFEESKNSSLFLLAML